MRPEVLSFLFLGWFLFVLYRKPASWLVWTLPLTQLLWVNSHIYFFMSPFVWIAFLVGIAAKDGWRAITRRHLLVTLAIAGATLLNPYGLDGALFPLRVFGSYGYSVLENQNPFFLKAWGYPQLTSVSLYIGIVLTAISFAVNARRFRSNIFGALITIATAILALTMLRNFPLFALCMMPAVLQNIDQVGWRFGSHAALGWGIVLLALFGVDIASGQFHEQVTLSRRFGPIVPAGHREPVEFYRTAGIHGPIFNNFDIGSFLIWQLPEEPVFIDGRPEAYPPDFIQDVYKGMQEDPEIWREQAEQYGINAIFWNEYDITPWSRVFVARILKDPEWVIVYRAQGIFILVRDVPENAAVIRQYRM
jgi:hypothetical protein